MHRHALGLVLLLVSGCLGGGPEPSNQPSENPAEPELQAADYVTGLQTVWDIAFAPDGRMFLTERAGRIRVVSPDGRLDPTPWATVTVAEGGAAQGEYGLMGLALDPAFPDPPYVYAYYTFGAQAAPLTNRLVRFTESNGRGTAETILLDGVAANAIHDGGRIRFGPDGTIYVTTGDAGVDRLGQDATSRNGKILRLNPDGSVPGDNPDPSSPVWTMGHRNPQGLCWHPATGELYSTEHGPDVDDEINLIEKGRNYGWPDATGTDDGGGQFAPALTEWTPTIAPAGCTFYHDADNSWPTWQDNLLLVTLKERDLRRLILDPLDPTTVLEEQILFDNEYGRLRALTLGPDGALYIGTSQRDGRATPGPGDDRVLRVTLA